MLAEALPYLQRFAGKTIVIKYGGAAMKDPSLKVLYSFLSCMIACTARGLIQIQQRSSITSCMYWLLVGRPVQC